MAGGLTISTLNDSSGVLATQNGMSGIAKAWVNINGASGASPTTRASFNISSVTRAGTGLYTVTFTTAMPDANYSVSLSTIQDIGGQGTFAMIQGGTTPSTTSFNVLVKNYTNSNTDEPYVYVCVNR